MAPTADIVDDNDGMQKSRQLTRHRGNWGLATDACLVEMQEEDDDQDQKEINEGMSYMNAIDRLDSVC